MPIFKRGCVVLLVILASACGSDSPSSPTSSSSSGIAVLVVFAPVGGTYTAQLNNQTYTATGGFTVNLSPGTTYQVTGSFVGQGFGVAFSSLTLGGGGVQSGSVRSVSGPSAQVSSCQVVYTNLDSPNTQRSFQVSFTITSANGSACQ